MRFTKVFALIFLLAQAPLMARDTAAPAPAPAADAAQPTTTVRNPAADGIKSMMLMGVFVLGMWFLLIAPQRKKAKELESTLKTLKSGDKIVTSSGILGVVLGIKDKTLSIRSADTKLEILKSSVQEVLERSAEPSESKS
ncbi:MAG TPA: preprotein translocase subunit YajC [Verrucomicrobiae bacterium]